MSRLKRTSSGIDSLNGFGGGIVFSYDSEGIFMHRHLVVPNYRESRSLRCQLTIMTRTIKTIDKDNDKTDNDNDKDKDKDKDNSDLAKLLLCTLARQSHPCVENNESDWND